MQFIICSDGTVEQLQGLVDRQDAIFASGLQNSDISDISVLKNADMLICSISSYSIWAAFLSNSPYIWYRQNLIALEGGRVNRFIRSLGIYSGNGKKSFPGGRSVAMGMSESMPVYMLNNLRALLKAKKSHLDLVRGGSVS